MVETIGDLFASKDPGLLKNAAVTLKGVALADWLVEHKYDHVHAYWLSTPATVALLAARVAGVTWSATAHRWDIYERNALDVKARTAAFVRAISARGAADIWERMPALQERVLHLRLGAAVPEAPAQMRRHDGTLRIVCPAALVPVKGHADLLEALHRLRSWGVAVHCTLAGRGWMRQTIEQHAASLGIRTCIDFAGFIPTDELHARYREGRYDAVVLASRANGVTQMEGVPSALIEAMAAGVPVVATDSGSISELVDNHCGWLVPPAHPDALARALLELYLNPGTARVRARRAFDVVRERHDVRTQMKALAQELCAQRSLA
jgi:glycosyltransferase involved in cell wall biosynthesis